MLNREKMKFIRTVQCCDWYNESTVQVLVVARVFQRWLIVQPSLDCCSISYEVETKTWYTWTEEYSKCPRLLQTRNKEEPLYGREMHYIKHEPVLLYSSNDIISDMIQYVVSYYHTWLVYCVPTIHTTSVKGNTAGRRKCLSRMTWNIELGVPRRNFCAKLETQLLANIWVSGKAKWNLYPIRNIVI